MCERVERHVLLPATGRKRHRTYVDAAQSLGLNVKTGIPSLILDRRSAGLQHRYLLTR
jgi:hypothetical protein